MASENLHVPRERLSPEALLLHYAIASLMEELEAIDWYRQRADDSEDEALRELLLHNMREEMEHASMLLEWIRRRNGDFAGHLKTYLFSEGPLVGIETAATGAAGPQAANAGSPAQSTPALGSLKGTR